MCHYFSPFYIKDEAELPLSSEIKITIRPIIIPIGSATRKLNTPIIGNKKYIAKPYSTSPTITIKILNKIFMFNLLFQMD
jgi:hypothetical protein